MVALVLSAGGMFGAYQAGAWKALAEVMKPDLVVGTSAGSLNGWAIAGGCSPEQLIEIWSDPAAANFMRRQIPLPPWRGFFDTAPLARHVDKLYKRFRPKVLFSLTVVEVPKLRQVRVPGDQVTPAHLMASCAVPFGYPPVRIGGKYYVDGGFLDILPVWAAIEMGATVAIAVNALPMMPSQIVRGVTGIARRFAPPQPHRGGIPVIEIRPRQTLGSLSDAVTWNEALIRRWISQGEEDARAAEVAARLRR
jgi:NTE family protein